MGSRWFSYVPILRQEKRAALRGVGLPSGHVVVEDVDTVGAGWWYDWSCTPARLNDERYVPTQFGGGGMVALPANYAGYVMVFNEPEAMNQANLAPDVAAEWVKRMNQKLPSARLIVGGYGWFGRNWAARFRVELDRLGARVDGFHVHGYVELDITADDLKEFWLWQWEAINRQQGELWISEFAETHGQIDAARELIGWVRGTPWVSRYAWFANRLTGREWYYPLTWGAANGVRLVDDEGGLTDVGRVYAGL